MNKRWRNRFLFLMLVVCLLGIVQFVQVYANAEKPIAIVSNLSDLQMAIEKAEDGDVIAIDAGMNILEDAIIGDSNKTITLRRNSNTSLIYVKSGYNILFRNLVFDGVGISSQYPFIDISNNVTFDNVVFKNFASSSNGGVISAASGEIYFSNCTFENNKALNGGHVAISGDAILSFDSCSFIDGNATENGGAIYNGVSSSTVNITKSTITQNEAGNVGGGVYNHGAMTISETKLYGNIASIGGSEIANVGWMGFDDSDAALQELYGNDERINPIGWFADYSDGEPYTRYLQLEYELLPTEVILAPSSLGTAGDSKIIGLEAGKHYTVTLDDTIHYVKGDGSLTTNESEGDALEGTEIIGLTNGLTYLVEEYTPIVEEPTDETPVDEEPPADEQPNDKEEPNDTEQDVSSDDQNQDENASDSQNGKILSEQEHSSSLNADISDINPNSTVNNYFYSDNGSSYTRENSTQLPYSGALPSNNGQPSINIEPGNPIEFEVNDEGVSININVNVGADDSDDSEAIEQPYIQELVASERIEPIQEESSGMPWMEVIKIGLLLGILGIILKKA
ncbi:hypothetical protein [Tepidibacillus decaturensis]|uniref:Right handed beta helix domain-containing protein n=1 Tax=Tepidibacillus decaturensis TaxID=1413211 RepID=A0A135L108_9BACI|nr:hypothetical protein [Tepidibacillus decaturensis]KXG42664.1 hypothetical protein U473_00330 [Tepidibacillus decaturensis]